MPRPRPNLRPLRWPALLTSAAILLLYLSTIWFTTGFWFFAGAISSTYAAGAQTGTFTFERLTPAFSPFPSHFVFYPRKDPDWYWWFHSTLVTGYTELRIPLWLPLLLTAIPTSLLWRSHLRHRRQSRLDSCPSCHYPLTNLPPSSPCPECGRARPADRYF